MEGVLLLLPVVRIALVVMTLIFFLLTWMGPSNG